MISKKKVLVIGQTPPPLGGQALMIQYMLDGVYENIELHHVRMQFSKDLNERGRFSFHKIVHLFLVIVNVWIVRFTKHTSILYYPVSSAPRVALLRDAIILCFTRFLFKKIVFHFHAAGVSEELPQYNCLLRTIVYFILKEPDLAITSSEHNPKDGKYLKAKKITIIPLGIPDDNINRCRKVYNKYKPLKVLFVGLMNNTKGEGYLLEAGRILAQRGLCIEIWLAGRFETDDYKNNYCSLIEKYGLTKCVKYCGIVSGDKKRRLFLEADVFCFPSFFSSESFGMVLLEAMMYQMPIIATKWRGLQSVVEDGGNGFLVDIKNANQIANSIETIHNNRYLIWKMGKYGRLLFEKKYRLDRYLSQLEKELIEL